MSSFKISELYNIKYQGGYEKDFLLGKQIIAVINLGSRKMGPEISEALILGVTNDK